MSLTSLPKRCPQPRPTRTHAQRSVRNLRRSLAWAIALLCASKLTQEAAPAAETFSPSQIEFFEQKIRPVLAEKCYDCHGSEAKSVKGGLLLDSRDGWLKGGDTGPALVPGDPEKSLGISAIHYTDEELLMPPKKSGGKLSETIIRDFEKWVREGAAWPVEKKSVKKLAKFDIEERKHSHWCWTPPALPPIPAVQNIAWPKSDIDRFILSKLESRGLRPAPETERSTLLRRVTFALTGLPPTPEEIRAFLADSSPTAFEQVVDRLLASPHFGEHWARHWMDLVRYAEGRGHEFDYTIPNAWQYRDYLIRAFNADLPYPQFVREHIAGDLIAPRLRPGTTLNESILGTGFWFLGEEVHSPVDIRQDEADRIDNRLDVLSKTFLGVTVTCARCHDHKFDPISQKDYTALAGMLLSSSNRQVRFETLETERRIAEALAQLRSSAQAPLAESLPPLLQPALNHAAETLLELRKHLIEHTPIPANLVPWEKECAEAKKTPAHPLHLFAKIALDERLAAPGAFHPALRDALLARSKSATPTSASSPAARVLADYRLPGATPWLQDGFSFGTAPVAAGELLLAGTPQQPSLSLNLVGSAQRQALWKSILSGGETEPGSLKDFARSGQTLRSPETVLTSGTLWYLVRGAGKAYACVDSHLMIGGPLHAKLLLRWKDSGSWQWISHNLADYKNHRLHVEWMPEAAGDFHIAMAVDAPEKPPLPFADNPASAALLDLLNRDSLSAETLAQAIEHTLLQANEAISTRSLAQHPPLAAWADWLLQHWELLLPRNHPASETLRKTVAPWLAKAEAISADFQPKSQTAPAMFEGSGVDDFLLRRGSTRSPMAPVPRRFLEAVSGTAPFQTSLGSGRLQLADHILSAQNPLTQRVIVNRVWHHLFGRGIVPTVDNFGVLGQLPSHPELLDHLALRFAGEWNGSLKSLIRSIVLSRVFALSSSPSDASAETSDPDNLLLHRMNLRRLQGESIRDSLLAASGRLDRALGGPSIPIYITPFMEGRGRPQSGPLDGAGRRSVYISIKRNFLSPMMLAFDMPIPFQGVGRRNVSNVPAQSLVLMNDPLVVEQAALCAKNLPPEQSAPDRVRSLYLRAFARDPLPEELADALQFVETSPTGREGKNGDTTAWADLCHVLFNAKEFIHVH
jgi:hypothetical protein